jgi:ubiquinone/menaquinone biosynthesis C-methylase UbiE
MKNPEPNPETENREHWDEVAPIHLRSYGIEGLLTGNSQMDEIPKKELYPISGKELIHLQCHIGTDTISLALDGAKVTGVDFSSKSIEIARDLAKKANVQAEFILANVLDLQNIIQKKFDIVYTSKGVLCWISDIHKWAQTISYLLKPGGIFYILEVHPFAMIFDENNEKDLIIRYPYFAQKEPTHFTDDHPDYADDTYIPKKKTYEWAWPISEIVNSLIQNNLTINFIHEYNILFFKAYSQMNPVNDEWWGYEKYKNNIPFTFSIKATRSKY